MVSSRHRHRAHEAAVKDTFARLLAGAQAGTDPGFQELLTANKHRADLPAPAGLRRLLLGRRVVRLEFGLGYRRCGAQAFLDWWLSEVGFPGDVDEVGAYIAGSLTGAGLACRRSEEGLSCSAQEAGTSQGVEVQGPRPWTGGKEKACGVKIRWSAQRRHAGPALSVQDVLARLPALRDARVDPLLVAGLGRLPAAQVSVGGTWTRYYSWDVRVCGGPSLRMELSRRLLEAGFGAPEKEAGYERFSRPRTGSYALLYEPEPGGSVRLSIQPES